MKHKVAELEGALLDAAVAMAEGLQLTEGHNTGESVWTDGGACIGRGDGDLRRFAPSTDWGDGGPIIERERIELTNTEKGWYAAVNPWAYYRKSVIVADPPDAEAPTPLIAAMRAYVASKLGDEIELPA